MYLASRGWLSAWLGGCRGGETSKAAEAWYSALGTLLTVWERVTMSQSSIPR